MAGDALKLNLGCGASRMDGFVNVDKYGEADTIHDLEVFPWPWADNSVDTVALIHVLEHLGRDPDVFIGIMKELYRVCAGGAQVQIVVPHPRHDNFLGDPTHVRVVTPQVLSLFDAELCRQWQAGGFANTPLALYHGVDFKMTAHQKVPDEPYNTMLTEGRLTPDELMVLERDRNNVVAEIRIALEVRK